MKNTWINRNILYISAQSMLIFVNMQNRKPVIKTIGKSRVAVEFRMLFNKEVIRTRAS